MVTDVSLLISQYEEDVLLGRNVAYFTVVVGTLFKQGGEGVEGFQYYIEQIGASRDDGYNEFACTNTKAAEKLIQSLVQK